MINMDSLEEFIKKSHKNSCVWNKQKQKKILFDLVNSAESLGHKEKKCTRKINQQFSINNGCFTCKTNVENLVFILYFFWGKINGPLRINGCTNQTLNSLCVCVYESM